MPSNLTTIWETIDRSVYEVLRLLLVTEGYLPDITNFPNTPTGVIAYEAEVANIAATKGFSIGLFGASSSYKKYEKVTPRIVYIPKRVSTGDIGGGNVIRWEKLGGEYLGRKSPTQTSNLQFEISLVAKDIRQLRVLLAVIGQVLSQRGYIPFYDNLESEFFIVQSSFRDFPDTEFGLLEKIYEYTAVDIWDKTQPVEFQASPLKQVTMDIQNGEDPEVITTIIP